MKRYIISLIALIAVFSACKKDAVNTPANDKKTVPVTFNVGFSQTTGTYNVSNNTGKLGPHTLAYSDPTLAANASTLYIAVYPSDGSHLFLTKQLSTDTVFGRISYNLPPGTYTVVFAAGQTNLSYSGTNLSNDYLVYSTYLGSGNYDNTWMDTFFKKMTITVGGTGTTQNVTLDRIDSQIIVDVEDVVPPNVKYMQVTAVASSGSTGNPWPSFSINTASPIGNNTYTMFTGTSLTTPMPTGGKNTKFAIIVLDASKQYTVQIKATDQVPGVNNTGSQVPPARGQFIGYAEVDNVALQTGHQTVLTGNLFGGNGLTNTGGFQVSVNPTWSSTTNTYTF